MQKLVRVDFDPDIDSLEESKVKAKKTAPINVKEADKPMCIDKNSNFFYYTFYYGYDNSLEPDAEYINPVDRVDNIKRLSELEKKELVISLKKVGRRAITETGFIVIAKRLFLAVNSLIKNDSRFTTVQQAYYYAIFAKKADFPEIEANEFMDIAELYIYYNCKRRGKTMDADKIISPREFKTILNLCRNHNTPCEPTVFVSMFLDIDSHDYGSWRMDEDWFDTTSINDALFTTSDGRPILNRKRDDAKPQVIHVDDYYNSVRLRNTIKQAPNADEVAETLEFQRFIGAEPSLLLTLGTSLCKSVTFYNKYGRFGAESLASTAITAVSENLSSRNSSLKTRVETIIRNNNVKSPDISLNNEICDYAKNLSNSDITRINSRGSYSTYYNVITLFILDKIWQFYNQPCDQNQINTIAAIIHYYLYVIDSIYENVRSIFHDKGDDYIDLLKMSKIVEDMVKNGDFCSYPSEFCVEKAKALYFSGKYGKN